jgi:outer membrane protein assembly factor BamB
LLAGCTTDSAAEDPGPSGATSSTPTSPSTPATSTVAPAWTATTAQPAFTAEPPNKGANPIVAGGAVVVLSGHQASAYDVATGELDWETDLPEEVCASSGRANDSGVVAVLLGADGTCARAAALDAATGELLWTVPLPAAPEPFGHQVAVGSSSVVVTGECTGFAVLALRDGSAVATVTGDNVGRDCASAASDGTTVVLASRGTIATYDAATGEQQSAWPAEGLGRVGDLLTQDPLVVTGRFASGGRLVDLSGARPEQFGRDRGGFGGEPAASVRVGDTLWVRYDDTSSLVGYDLTSRQEVGTVRVGSSARLVGSSDGRLVVTVGDTSPDGVELWLVDPAAPADPEVVGLLTRPDGEDGALAGSVVVDDHLVRLWPAQVEAFALT